MIKNYYRDCKNTKQVNNYLKKCKLEGFEFDEDYNFHLEGEFDFDNWINEEKTKGVSLRVTPNSNRLEVFISKYTNKDIAKLEKEIA